MDVEFPLEGSRSGRSGEKFKKLKTESPKKTCQNLLMGGSGRKNTLPG